MSAALVVGVALAVACLAYVVYPLIRQHRGRGDEGPARAAAARPLREVTDDEIEAVVQAFRETHFAPGACRNCGPRPEPDAVYCSSCGCRLDEPLRPPAAS